MLIVEDHPSVARGLELLLPRHGFRVIGTARSAAEGLEMLRARKPDVALIDIGLGADSGTALADRALAEGSTTEIVLHTGSVSKVLIDEAVSSGARGIVLKTSPIEHLANALRAAAAGRDYVDVSIAGLLGRPAGRTQPVTSKREAEILALLARGMTTDQVAVELFLSPETIHTHVRNACRKLGARGRLHAVMLALGNGEIEIPGDPGEGAPVAH